MNSISDLQYWFFHNLIDYTKYLIEGDLTEDGVQWSAEVTTADAGVDVEVLKVTVESPIPFSCKFKLIEIKLNLVAAFKATTLTADVTWKWQIRNKDGTWIDLHTAITNADIGTTYVEKTVSGYFPPQTNIDQLPLEIRLLLQCNEANAGLGKVKNSSYVKVLARVYD